MQNNTGNKSAFPVRIHPHLQAPHHHQNATASPAAFINSTPAGNGGSSNASTWLFPAAGAHSNMQDEILGSEKPKAQPQELQENQEKQQQQLSPERESAIISELEKARAEESKVESGSSDGTNGKEKLRLESPVLTPFDYQEPSGLGTAAQSSTSSSLTSFNNWSAAIPATPSTIINEDISFFNPATSANNGPSAVPEFLPPCQPRLRGQLLPSDRSHLPAPPSSPPLPAPSQPAPAASPFSGQSPSTTVPPPQRPLRPDAASLQQPEQASLTLGQLPEPLALSFFHFVEPRWGLRWLGWLPGPRVPPWLEWWHDASQLHLTAEEDLPQQPHAPAEVLPHQSRIQPEVLDG